MKSLRKVLLLTLLPLFAFVNAHKFYISVTNVDYSSKDQAIQIITRIFVDDIDAVLEERYGIDSELNAAASPANVEYLERYLRTKLLVTINKKKTEYNIIGKKYDTDMVILYLEIPNVDLKTLTQITVENEVLTDLYDEQQNVVHFKIEGKKKSFVLIKSDTKGMLNL